MIICAVKALLTDQSGFAAAIASSTPLISATRLSLKDVPKLTTRISFSPISSWFLGSSFEASPHFDLVKREGGSISIYNLETKELNNIELGHDVEQMTINENVIYILSDKIIYQYELKDMNLYLKCKTQIKKSNEENYLSGIFYIKPESMKFTL